MFCKTETFFNLEKNIKEFNKCYICISPHAWCIIFIWVGYVTCECVYIFGNNGFNHQKI